MPTTIRWSILDNSKAAHGARELRAARREAVGLIWSAILFSLVVNALMLTGPLYSCDL